jgi:predicted RNA-binding protein
MTKYFLICASKDHVQEAVAGGFAQAGHGREDYMNMLSKGDWVVFYSSKDKLDQGKPLQKFTAIGQVTDEEPYQSEVSSKFKPYRRTLEYITCQEADIRPLLDHLSFIKNKQTWGYYLLSGFRKLSKVDFERIQKAMQ